MLSGCHLNTVCGTDAGGQTKENGTSESKVSAGVSEIESFNMKTFELKWILGISSHCLAILGISRHSEAFACIASPKCGFH